MSLVAPLGQEFRFCSGEITSGLREFLNVLRKLSPESFAHHVNAERNDFYNWIEYSLKEPKLAKSIQKLKSKTAMVIAISKFLKTRKK